MSKTVYVEIPHTNDDDVDLLKFADLQQAVNYLTQNGDESFQIASEDARNAMFEPEDYTDMSNE